MGSLHPNVRIWEDDFIELGDLLKRAGHEQFTTLVPNTVFLTSELEGARRYARTGPEVWTRLVGDRNQTSRNREKGLRQFYELLLCYQHLHVTSDFISFAELYDSDISLNRIAIHSGLIIDQVLRARELFFKYWARFSHIGPVVLVFDKEVVRSLGGVFDNLFDYDTFRRIVVESEEWGKRTAKDILGRVKIAMTEPVSLDHLVAVEKLG